MNPYFVLFYTKLFSYKLFYKLCCCTPISEFFDFLVIRHGDFWKFYQDNCYRNIKDFINSGTTMLHEETLVNISFKMLEMILFYPHYNPAFVIMEHNRVYLSNIHWQINLSYFVKPCLCIFPLSHILVGHSFDNCNCLETWAVTRKLCRREHLSEEYRIPIIIPSQENQQKKAK